MLSDLLHRLRAMFRRNAVERELDDELRFHFEQQVEKHVRSGLTQAEAARRVRMEFGSDRLRKRNAAGRVVCPRWKALRKICVMPSEACAAVLPSRSPPF